MKVADIVEMNSHDKQTIFEAYSLEHHTRKALNKQLNDERRTSQALRFDCQAYQDMWLEEHVRNNVAVEGDIDEAISSYFAHKGRKLFLTPSNGYFAITEEEDHLFIVFAWGNQKHWRREIRDMTDLIKRIASYGKPIYYTGVNNILKNHSEEVTKGLYKLKL